MPATVNADLLHIRLDSAVTQWDARQSKKRGYHPFALGIYLERVESVVALVRKGMPVPDAIDRNFNDRLASYLHKVKY